MATGKSAELQVPLSISMAGIVQPGATGKGDRRSHPWLLHCSLAQRKPPGRGRVVDRDTLPLAGAGLGGDLGTATTLKARDQRSPSPRKGATEWGCQAGKT